jgi:hypothetical protein
VEALSFSLRSRFSASRLISFQSPRIKATFFARLQPLIWRSADRASYLLGNSSLQTSVTGRRVDV